MKPSSTFFGLSARTSLSARTPRAARQSSASAFITCHCRRTHTHSNMSLKDAEEFVEFVNESPTPYHVVANIKFRLKKAGFRELREREDWSRECLPGNKYFVTRNTSSIIAFAIGGKWVPGNGAAMVGAHTDSPCLRLKPVSKAESNGWVMVGVETYGGLLSHTWFDRDLAMAGRVFVQTAEGKFQQKLVHVDKPLMRIPSLAIHLDRQEPFTFEREQHLYPLAGLVAKELNGTGGNGNATPDSSSGGSSETVKSDEHQFQPLQAPMERHHPKVVELIAKEAGVKPTDVVDFEMLLFDHQKAVIGGLNDELIYSARLDNLGMTFCGTMGIIRAAESSLATETGLRLFATFDHEEVGSTSSHGADSSFLPDVVKRLSALPAKGKKEVSATAYEQTLSQSFLISADMAHSVHPNYAGKYEARHRPLCNNGPVIKVNANQRYTTNSPGIALIHEVASRAKVPLQLFVVPNGSPCGRTIGPMLAAALGTRTLDLGNPQLSMHSIRETGGVKDVGLAISLFKTFYEQYSELGVNILQDEDER